MKKIAVLFDERAYNEFTSDQYEYGRSYLNFAKRIFAKDTLFYICWEWDFYQGKNTWGKGLVYDNDSDSFVPFSESTEMNLLWQKNFVHEPDDSAHVLNTNSFEELLENKWETYQLFPDLFPNTKIVQSREELKKVLDEISGKTLVAKPLDSYGGRGIVIGSRTEILAQVDTFPYLIQEFCSLEKGIPSFGIGGSHDFRLVVVGGTLTSAFVRTPPEGSLLANVSMGGATHDISLEQIPAELISIFEQVDAILAPLSASRMYTIDLVLCGGCHWKILELNPNCALFHPERGIGFERFHEALAEFLVDSV